jgi:regulator of protease activity HflC (stomatin/prohibitin superfamily)
MVNSLIVGLVVWALTFLALVELFIQPNGPWGWTFSILISVLIGWVIMFVISLFMRARWAAEVATFLGFPGSGEVGEEYRLIMEKQSAFYSVLGRGPFWFPPGLYEPRGEPIQVTNRTRRILTDDDHPATMVLADGVVVAVGAEIVYRILNPDPGQEYDAGDGKIHTGTYRFIYESQDSEAELEDLVDPALDGRVTSFPSVDALIALRVYEFWESGLIEDTPGDLVRTRIKEAAARIGVEILRVQAQRFDQSAQAKEAREDVNKAERDAEAAAFRASSRAQETTGALIANIANATGRSIQEVQQEVATNPGLEEEIRGFAKDMIMRPPGQRQIQDIEIRGGGGDLGEMIMRVLAAFRAANNH